jgi:hypothetical protein
MMGEWLFLVRSPPWVLVMLPLYVRASSAWTINFRPAPLACSRRHSESGSSFSLW